MKQWLASRARAHTYYAITFFTVIRQKPYFQASVRTSPRLVRTLPRYPHDTTVVPYGHYRGTLATLPRCTHGFLLALTDESRKCNYAVTRARGRWCTMSRYHRVTFVCGRDRKFGSLRKSHYICIVKTTTNLMIRCTAHDYFRACRLKRMK